MTVVHLRVKQEGTSGQRMRTFNIEETILYEDKDIIVCQKPPAVAVQSRRIGSMDMEAALKNYFVKKGEMPYVGLVHRLDQPVQGILVFGKNKESTAFLSRQLLDNRMEKIYLACVEGVPSVKEACLVDEIEKEQKTNLSKIVDKKTKNSKTAILEYKLIKSEAKRSLLEIHLKTGRHHQIRVQLAHGGFPIVGDAKYNPKVGIDPSGQEIALCAYKLSFIHPVSKKKMEFQVKPLGNFPIV